MDGDEDLETQFTQWRAHMGRRRAVRDGDVDELEDHLRTTVVELVDVGLRPDEAFLVAVKRMGNQDELSREFAQVHSERLWKQLVLAGGPEEAPTRAGLPRDLLLALGCALGAAVGIKVPELFGVDFTEDGLFYASNLGFFALVPLAGYIALRRRLAVPVVAVLAALFLLGMIGANAYPLAEDSQSVVLSAIHVPLALWFVVGLAYTGGQWRSHRRWMDFVRFTGEWLIYFVLIALGGGGPDRDDHRRLRGHRRRRHRLRAVLAAALRRHGRGRGRRLARRGEAERRREHGPGSDEGVHPRCSPPPCWPSWSPCCGPGPSSMSSATC